MKLSDFQYAFFGFDLRIPVGSQAFTEGPIPRLWPDAAYPCSVDPEIWHSAFVVAEREASAEDGRIPLFVGEAPYREVMGCWPSVSTLSLSVVEVGRHFDLVAFAFPRTILPSLPVDRLSGALTVMDPDSTELDMKSELLGFDVVDADMTSLLIGTDFGKHRNDLEAIAGDSNAFGLVSDEERALALSENLADLLPEHGPIIPVAVFRLGTLKDKGRFSPIADS